MPEVLVAAPLATAPASSGDARLIEVLERENAFLRLQVEAANRATAEAHAALRAALKMSERALPSPGSAPERQVLAAAAQEVPQSEGGGEVEQVDAGDEKARYGRQSAKAGQVLGAVEGFAGLAVENAARMKDR